MSKDKYVEQTLTLPSELPLFNYNINFQGLRHLLQGVNLQTNANSQLIVKLQEQINKKLPTSEFQSLEKKLNNSYLFGSCCQTYLDKAEQKSYKVHRKEAKDLTDAQQFCLKMNKMAEIVEYLMDKCQKHQEKINNDNHRHQKLIDQSFRRLEDKISSGLDSFTKTINTYFTQTNDKVSGLQSDLTLFKKTAESKFEDINQTLGKKVSDGNLHATLQGWESKIKKELESMLKNDHMQRLSTVNQVKQSFKEAQKDIDLKNKAAALKMQQLTDKVNKAMQINTFEIQKHKIYEKLSELKNRSDELVRKNGQFVEFRKNYLTNNQKIKQEIIGISDEINKMQNKESSFKKLENMSDVLNSLNPHLICEIGQEVKLHSVEIGKLQKMILTMDSKIQNSGGLEKTMPQVPSSQNSDLVQKIIKEYMSNMDFEGRVKRTEKDIIQLKKKNDAFNQLEKKIYALSKDIDVGAIMKELKRKCDQQNTRKDNRILDGKIQQLFEFYKQLRREVEDKKKVVNKSEPFESATLTTKRLFSANCISCTPNSNTPANRRQLAKSRMEMSLDYSLEGQRHTLYTRGK